MTDDERLAHLDQVLYFLARYSAAMARGAIHESHLAHVSVLSNEALDDMLAAIEWGIQQRDLDYRSMVPSLPADRATVVSWLQIALRDLRAFRATR